MNNRIQQWFNQIYLGLHQQGWKMSLDKTGKVCLYRGENGCKCAVGQVIPDDAYVIVNNYNAGIYVLSIAGQLDRLGLGEITQEEELFLQEAQQCHDGGAIGLGIQSNLDRMARNLGLIIPQLVQ